MFWLIITISAYFLFAMVALGDKYLLAGPPNPKSYSFYIGVLGMLSLLLIPFVGFSVPDLNQILISLLAGAIFVFAQLGLFTGLEYFEASRVVPAIGGFLPIFTFSLVYLFFGFIEVSFLEILAFLLLVIGGVLIACRRKNFFNSKSLWISIVAAFLFALSFTLAKIVYMSQPFWSGFIWMRIGGFLVAISLIFTKEVKNEIFGKKFTFQRKTGFLFLLNQSVGAGASLLQNWAIALVPLSYLAFVNALEGVKYIFVLLFAFLLPKILKEEISKGIIVQKIVAILFIGAGLLILSIF
ncbi:MAG: hypothetical protein ABH800_01510 [Candidatus Nealsonbacteria bacterium]